MIPEPAPGKDLQSMPNMPADGTSRISGKTPIPGNGSSPLTVQFLPDGTITALSDSFCRLVDGFRDDLVGKSVFAMIPEPERAGLRENLETLTPEHSMSFHEHGVFTQAGALRRQMWANRGIFDRRGHLCHCETACIDVTDRVGGEGLYRTLAERSMAGVYVVQDGKFAYLNRNAAAYACYEAEELTGTHARALVVPEDREKVRESSRRMLLGLSSSPYEFRIRTKDGALRWIMETVTAITFGGRPAVLGNSMDVTETKLAAEELEGIQGQQKALLDNIPDIAWMKDAQGRYIAVNGAFGRFCGRETGDILGRSDFEIFPPDLAQRFHNDGQAARTLRRKQVVEKALVTERGETLWLETVKTPILNDRDEVIGTAGIARDITERRRSEQALRESEARFRLLAENVTDVIMLFDRRGRSIYISPSVEQLLGYTPEEALGLEYRDVMKPGSLKAVMDFFRNHLWAGKADQDDFRESKTLELEVIRKDSAARWVEIKFKVLSEDESGAGHMVGVVRDIHERKLTETALRESEAKFKTLTDQTPVGILIHQDNVIRYAGQEAGRMMGYEDDSEFIGHPIMEFIHESDRRRIAEIGRRRMADDGAPAQYEARLVMKDGSALDVLISAMVIEYEGKKSTQAAFVDITERKKAAEALRKSESMFRLLAENVKDVILLTGLDGQTLYASPSIEQMLGYPLDELREKKYRDVMTPQTLQAVKTFLKEKVWDGKASHLDPAKPDVMELQAICRDGSIKDVEVRFSVLPNDAGEPYRILSVMRDITKRKAAERALRESEERLRLAQSAAHVGIWDWDLQSGKVKWTAELESLYGFEEGTFPGTYDAFLERVHPDDREKAESLPGEAVHGKKPFDFDFRVQLPSGETRWVNDKGSAVYDEEGNPRRIFGVNVDITERKRAEETLRESEAKFRALADNIPVGVVIHENGRLRYAGAHVAAMLGYDRTKPITDVTVLDFIHADDRSRVLDVMAKRAAGKGAPDSYEARLIRRDGTVMDALIHSATMIFEEGRKATLTAFTDITERKRSEAALRESEAKFRALADSTPVGILIHHNGIIQYAGQEAGRMMGYESLDECVGRSIMEYIHPDDRARIADITRRRIAGEDAPAQYEARLVRKDSTILHVLLCPMMIDYGGQRCTQAAFMDITEHKKAADALRQSEAKLQSLLRAAPIGIGLVHHRVFDWVNEGMCRMTGYSAEELKGSGADILYPDRREALRVGTTLRRQLSKKGIGSVETKWTTKDGRVIDVFLRSSVAQDTGRLSAGTVLTAMDITEIKDTEAALSESRQRMSDIINFLPDATCVIDRQGCVIAWNHAMEHLSGVKASDMLGKGNYEHAVPFVGRRQPVLIDMAMNPEELTGKACVRIDRNGDVLSGEIRMADAPGEERCLQTIAAPFRDSAGNVTGAIACLRDMTDQKKAEKFLQSLTRGLRRKVQEKAHDLKIANTLLRVELEEHRRTEEALRKSEQRYRAIVEDQNEMICRFGPDHNITFVNEAFCAYAGQSREDLIGISFSPLFDPDERERVENILLNLDRENAGQSVECRGFASEGKARWQQWALRAVYDDNGRFIEYQAVGRDSTEQKAFEMQLQQSRNMLRSVFDGIADPLMMVGRDLKVLMLNRAALERYDIRNYGDIIGEEVHRSLFGQYTPDDTDRILQGIRGKKALSFDLATVGEPSKYEKVFIYPVRGESRKDGAAIVRISDITKERILERQSSQSEKLASLGLLVSGLVHEINNPNNFIIFNMPILRDYVKELLPIIDAHADGQDRYELFSMPYEEFREDLLKLLKNIEHGAHRINTTIGKLREFTGKRESGERCWTKLPEIVEKAVAICQPQIKSHVRHFDVNLPQDLPRIFTDPESLEQILINLLVNAAQASDKADSRVTLRVIKGKTWQNRFIIEVIDNGCGMDAATIQKIFDPFFTTKPPGLGTGLGLYISHSQIERLGGQIEVESRPGEGSTFRITLPDVDARVGGMH